MQIIIVIMRDHQNKNTSITRIFFKSSYQRKLAKKFFFNYVFPETAEIDTKRKSRPNNYLKIFKLTHTNDPFIHSMCALKGMELQVL